MNRLMSTAILAAVSVCATGAPKTGANAANSLRFDPNNYTEQTLNYNLDDLFSWIQSVNQQ